MSTPFQNRCPSTPADKAGCLEPAALKREHTSPRHRGAPGSPALPPTTDNVLGSRGWAPACPSRRALPTSAQVSTTARGACVNQAASVVFTLSPSAPRSAGMAGGAHHPNMAVTWSLSPATPDPPTARLGPPWRQLTRQRGCAPHRESTASRDPGLDTRLLALGWRQG